MNNVGLPTSNYQPIVTPFSETPEENRAPEAELLDMLQEMNINYENYEERNEPLSHLVARKAAAQGRIDLLDRLIVGGYININDVSHNIAFAAIERKNRPVLHWILDREDIDLSQTNDDGRTIFNIITRGADLEIFKKLLDRAILANRELSQAEKVQVQEAQKSKTDSLPLYTIDGSEFRWHLGLSIGTLKKQLFREKSIVKIAFEDRILQDEVVLTEDFIQEVERAKAVIQIVYQRGITGEMLHAWFGFPVQIKHQENCQPNDSTFNADIIESFYVNSSNELIIIINEEI